MARGLPPCEVRGGAPAGKTVGGVFVCFCCGFGGRFGEERVPRRATRMDSNIEKCF